MFKSLYFKDVVQREVDTCCDDRYEGTGLNDKTLGKMFYLKQFAKAADALYEKLRGEIDHKDAVDRTVVAQDKFFSVQASMRQGSSKIDRDAVITKIAALLDGYSDSEGNALYPGIKAKIEATQIVDECTIIGKGSTVIQVVESAQS